MAALLGADTRSGYRMREIPRRLAAIGLRVRLRGGLRSGIESQCSRGPTAVTEDVERARAPSLLGVDA